MPDKCTAEPKPYSISFYIILGAALFAFIRTFSLISPILLSLLLVLLISLAVNPMITWMRTRKGGRKVPTGLLAMGSIVVIGLTCWAFFGPMKASVVTISETLPGYWERLQKPLIKIEQQSIIFEEKLQAEVSTEIAEDNSVLGVKDVLSPKKKPIPPTPPASSKAADTLRASLSKMIRDALGSFTAVAFNGAQILVVLVTVFFGVVFMLMNPRPIFGAMISFFPERHHDQVVTILQRIGKFVPIWAGATLLGMLTIGMLVFILMWPIFGFMDALVLGLVACVLEAIPFLGPILSAVPALLLAVGKGGLTPLWVVLVYIAIQAFENNVIMPYIMARRLKLHPLAVVFSMLLSIAAFGVLGVLIAAPMVAVVTILHDELYRKRFLPTTTNAELDHLAGIALNEKPPINTPPLASTRDTSTAG
ncbi:MAG: AI-2E family transporter [Proteobacteria bacterium]|nr:AI-2E family transporter [Pseudomonadota bacterium]